MFAKVTITSLIYYMLVQDHNSDQSKPSFGFCYIPNCMRMIINFYCLQICNLGIILHIIFCKEFRMSLMQLSMSGVLVTYVRVCA